ncbi:MAG: RHS repeat domain-containing protein [Tepidiformaceae bacterium]
MTTKTLPSGTGVVSSYTYDDADRLTEVDPPSASPVAYTWDDNGSLTARGSDTFAWDYEERMVEATVNSVTTTFAYRGDGLRDSRTTNSVTTGFTWDIAAGLPVVIDDGAKYVYGAGLEAQISGANTYYYLADGLGSTVKTVDASGNVVNSYTYDIYGKKTSSTGSQANEFDFAGQQTDPTGLQYLRARYVDPETGVFISREPLAARIGWLGNPFGYAGGNPASLIDPTGLYPVEGGEPSYNCQHAYPQCVAYGEEPYDPGEPIDIGAIVDSAVDVVTGVIGTSADALKPPYTLNDLMTGVQLLDIVPVGAICLGFGVATGGIVAIACAAVDKAINWAATAASVIQLMQSSCGWNDWQTYAYTGAVIVNVIAPPTNGVIQAGEEGAAYAIQTALLNTAECQGQTTLVGGISFSLAEKP